MPTVRAGRSAASPAPRWKALLPKADSSSAVRSESEMPPGENLSPKSDDFC